MSPFRKFLAAAALLAVSLGANALNVVKEATGYRSDWFTAPIHGQGDFLETQCNARKGYTFVRTKAQYPATFSADQLQQVWEDDKEMTEQADWYIRYDAAVNKTRVFARNGLALPPQIAALGTERGGPPPKQPLDCRSRKPVVGAPGKQTIEDVLVELAAREPGPTTVRLPNGYGTAPATVYMEDDYYVLEFVFDAEAKRSRVIEAFDSYMTQGLTPYTSSTSLSPLGRAVQDDVFEARNGQEYVKTVIYEAQTPGEYVLQVRAKRPKKR